MTGTSDKLAFPPPQVYQCPGCAGSMKSYTQELLVNIICDSCGALCRLNYKRELVSTSKIKEAKTATFKPGTAFEIEGVNFVVIGYVVKTDTNYPGEWTEFLLFNPIYNCITLHESNGHYLLVKPTRFYVPGLNNQKSVKLEDGSTYELFARYKFKILKAGGEFTTELLRGTSPACIDYINPPYLLAFEKGVNEVCWYKGEYCSHKTVLGWLKKPVSLPSAEGIAPCQPHALNFSYNSLKKISLLAGVLLTLLFVISAAFSKDEEVYSDTFYEVEQTSGKNIVSGSFEITEDNKAAEVLLSSATANSWVDVDLTLVNETTGDQYFVSKGLEYYSGFTDGEAWSEGSNGTNVLISNVKKGRYHLNLLLTSSPGPGAYRQLNVYVKQDVPIALNYFIALTLILAFPALLYYQKRNFEKKRWYYSDYSPFDYYD